MMVYYNDHITGYSIISNLPNNQQNGALPLSLQNSDSWRNDNGHESQNTSRRPEPKIPMDFMLSSSWKRWVDSCLGYTKWAPKKQLFYKYKVGPYQLHMWLSPGVISPYW